MATVPVVPAEEWASLYLAAEAFRDLAPWQFMEGDSPFAVANPEKPEVGYCCVMGQLGEVFGAAIYLGRDGLASIEDLFADDGPSNPAEAVLRKRCVVMEFVGSGEIEKEDKAVLKQLGLKYRGRNAWPLFRSIRPGFAPWFLENWEVRYLTIVLQQAIYVCNLVREKSKAIVPEREGQYFLREQHVKDGKIEWTDRWFTPEPYKKPELPNLTFDEIRFAAASRKIKHVTKVWEMDLTMLPMTIMDDARPRFMRCFMVVDPESGYAFAAEPMDSGKFQELLLPRIIEIFESTGVMPKTILFRNEELRSLLHNPLRRMGIESKFVRVLPVVEKVYSGMIEFFGNV